MKMQRPCPNINPALLMCQRLSLKAASGLPRNKRYIEAVVYDLRQSVQTVADLKRTVLRQAWKRSQRIKKQLQEAGVPLTPLLLVQVANGDKTVEEAEQDLIKLCGVHPALIGKHSSDDPDPVLMAAIANDSSKEVLIFKQSAGTGFDAPRAFVLASTKSVNEADFAMQFIGRVMRVSRPIREAYPKPTPIPPDFDTAFVYLANAEAQRGFEAAVQASSAVKSQLEGQTEKLLVRQTGSGAVVLTNRETPQAPLMYDMPLPDSKTECDFPTYDPAPLDSAGPQQNLFGVDVADDGYVLDEVLSALATPEAVAARKKETPHSEAELLNFLSEKGIGANRIAILNVAGPRESKRPGIYRATLNLLQITASLIEQRNPLQASRENGLAE